MKQKQLFLAILTSGQGCKLSPRNELWCDKMFKKPLAAFCSACRQSARLSKRRNLSEAIYCRMKESSEALDRFTSVARTSVKNVSFPRTPALLMLIFCRIVHCECRTKMATNRLKEKLKVICKRP